MQTKRDNAKILMTQLLAEGWKLQALRLVHGETKDMKCLREMQAVRKEMKRITDFMEESEREN